MKLYYIQGKTGKYITEKYNISKGQIYYRIKEIKYWHMKVSNDLKVRLDELKRIGSTHMNYPQKKELADLWKEYGGETLNVNCATCVLRVAHKVNKILVDSVGVSNLVSRANVIHVKDVKMVKLTYEQLNEMKLPELRKIDKDVKATSKAKWMKIYLSK